MAADLPRGRFLDRRTPPSLVTLVLIAGLSTLSMALLVPSLPAIAAEFGTSYQVAQLAVSGYMLSNAALLLLIGPLADGLGRRRVMLASLGIYVLASAGCLLASDITLFLVARLVQSVIAAGVLISRAVVRDIASEGRSASMIGYVTAGMAVMPMLAPSLGGWLHDVAGWRANLWVLELAGLVALVLCWFDLGETGATGRGPERTAAAGAVRAGTGAGQAHTGQAHTGQVGTGAPGPAPATGQGAAGRRRGAAGLSAYGAVLRQPLFWAYAMTAAFSASVSHAFIGGAPFVAEQVFGLDGFAFGLWMGLAPLGFLAGNMLSGRFSPRMGIDRMMIAGTGLILGALALSAGAFLAGSGGAAALFLPTLLIGCGNGMTMSNATAGALAGLPRAAGTAAGLSAALLIGTGALASMAPGAAFAAGAGVPALLGIMAAMALASCGTILLAIRLNRGRRV